MGPKERSVLSQSLDPLCSAKMQKVGDPACNKSLQTAFRISILDTSLVPRLCVMLKAAQTGLISLVIGLLK
jgi:hypothetical protein